MAKERSYWIPLVYILIKISNVTVSRLGLRNRNNEYIYIYIYIYILFIYILGLNSAQPHAEKRVRCLGRIFAQSCQHEKPET